MPLPACAPLPIAAGGVPSITVRETFEMAVMTVARIEAAGASAVANTVIVTAGTEGVRIAVIVVMTVVASAVMIAVKIVCVRIAVIAVMTVAASPVVIAVKIASVASAVIAVKPAVKIVLARSPKAMVPVADTTVATARMMVGNAATVGNVERVAANDAMMGATAATIGVELIGRGLARLRTRATLGRPVPGGVHVEALDCFNPSLSR
jgi:hypothetical protein